MVAVASASRGVVSRTTNDFWFLFAVVGFGVGAIVGAACVVGFGGDDTAIWADCATTVWVGGFGIAGFLSGCCAAWFDALAVGASGITGAFDGGAWVTYAVSGLADFAFGAEHAVAWVGDTFALVAVLTAWASDIGAWSRLCGIGLASSINARFVCVTFDTFATQDAFSVSTELS